MNPNRLARPKSQTSIAAGETSGEPFKFRLALYSCLVNRQRASDRPNTIAFGGNDCPDKSFDEMAFQAINWWASGLVLSWPKHVVR